jgi:hypothetical protein
MQMADFVAGFAGIDIGGDDDRILGLWPGRAEGTIDPAAQRMRQDFILKMRQPQ